MFGISAFAETSFASLAGQATLVALTGVQASGFAGTIGNLDGLVAIGSVGTIGMGQRSVAISGVSASGQVGTFDEFYWTTIDDSGTPNWQNVAMTV